MEITMHIRKSIINLTVAVTLGSILYSCSSQRGLAQVTTYDTIVVPPQYRQSKIDQQAVKPIAKRQQDPQQIKDFQEIMALVRKADRKFDQFDNIAAVNKTLLDIANNMVAKDVRYRSLSMTRDSMISAQARDLRAYKEDSKLWRELLAETERKRLEDRKEAVEASRLKRSQETLAQFGGIGAVILILLSIFGSNWLNRRKIEAQILQINKQPK